MLRQHNIIVAVNKALSKYKKIDFRLNLKGVCAGLSALYIKYYLEGNSRHFFDILQQLINLSEKDEISNHPHLHKFLLHLEHLQNQHAYSSYHEIQGRLEKLFKIKNSPIRNEYNVGLVATEIVWEQLFDQIKKEGRVYQVSGVNHAIAISYDEGKFTVYDPNGDKVEVLESVSDVIKEIKVCMNYEGEKWGLGIRVFASPNASLEDYPDKGQFHQQLKEGANSSTEKQTSLLFAADVDDVETIQYLFLSKNVSYAKINSLQEFTNNEVIKFIYNANSTASDYAACLLRFIAAALYVNNLDMLVVMVNKYLATFSSETQNDKLVDLFVRSQTYQVQLGKIANYGVLIDLFERHGLYKYKHLTPVHSILKLLTAIHFENEYEELAKWRKLDSEQLASIINLALKFCSANVLTFLAQNGFGFNQDAIEILIRRNNQKVFIACQNYIYEKGLNLPILQRLRQKPNLNYEFGDFRYVDVLIFLQHNELIKKEWENYAIGLDYAQFALCYAYLCHNFEIVEFLQDKKGVRLGNDLLNELFQQMIDKEDYLLLQNLSHSVNVLAKDKFSDKVLKMCYDHQDFSPVFISAKMMADGQILNLLTQLSNSGNYDQVIRWLVENKRSLCINYLNNHLGVVGQEGYLNRLAELLGKDALEFSGDGKSSDEWLTLLLFYLDKNYLFLTNYINKKIPIPLEILHNLVDKLISVRKQYALSYLFSFYHHLQDREGLLDKLCEHQCFTIIKRYFIQLKKPLNKKSGKLLIDSAIRRKDLQSFVALVENYTQQLESHLPSILSEVIDNNFIEVMDVILKLEEVKALDLTPYFIRASKLQCLAIADKLLEGKVNFPNSQDVKAYLEVLFGKQLSSEEVYEKIYCNGYGRLYQLAVKCYHPNPRFEWLSAVPLVNALIRKDWKLAVFILQRTPLNDSSLKGAKKLLQMNQEHIIQTMLANCFERIGIKDCREMLFSLIAGTNNSAMADVASNYKGLIHSKLIQLEEQMIKEGVKLNNQCYRYMGIFNGVDLSRDQWCVIAGGMKEGIKKYLANRPNTLGFFSKLFDATRGEYRAHHYAKLLDSCQSELHFSVVAYALLASKDGATLKASVATALGYQDVALAQADLAARLKKLINPAGPMTSLVMLNEVIARIVEKANGDHATDTLALFHPEIARLTLR